MSTETDSGDLVEEGNGASTLNALQKATDPVAEFLKNSPFLCMSLFAHIVVLGILAFFTAKKPPNVQREISLSLEEVKIDKVQHRVPRKEEDLTTLEKAGASTKAGAGASTEDYQTASDSTVKMDVANLETIGFQAPIGKGSGGQWSGRDGTGVGGLVTGDGGAGVKGAVDQFAVITINSIRRGETLVVLAIDRSPSILYGDLPRVIERMNHYFSEIDKYLPKSIRARGRWVVMSYGARPQFECKPSSNLHYIKNALKNVQSDPTGQENLGQAMEVLLNRYESSSFKNILIATMTDEASDDLLNNPKNLERLINRMRRVKARFFVFGYESTFCAQKKRVSIPITNMRGKDLAQWKAYAQATDRKIEDIKLDGWTDGGPECPAPELWWTKSWHHWRHWGGSISNIPSGFGMYTLNRLALATNGIYFLLKSESNYDQKKLYGKFKPDICSVPRYQNRMKQSHLRRLLHAIWLELSKYHLDHHLDNPKEVSKVMKTARQGRDYCAQRIRTLRDALNNAKPVANNFGRWEAHAMVTLAELYRMRFMLGQYYEVVSAKWDEVGHTLQGRQRLVVHKGKAPSDFVGPDRAKQEFEAARDNIQFVTEKYKDTPWEVISNRLRRGLHPWRCSVGKKPKPRPHIHHAHPPKMGL
ncbi:MAG: VWA domain-containing protein [Planctomycetes bacterium]|nr:VWA domain-containing protein [Planctomycetota bacterium]